SYSCAASLFGLIPLVGWLAGNLWSIYLSGIGFREMHQTSTVRAFGAVLIPICAGAAVWVIFGLQYNPLTVSKQSASANKPMISTTSTGTEFKTDVGKFAIITPLPLVEKKLTANTGLGKVDVSIFGAKQGNIEYTVACS